MLSDIEHSKDKLVRKSVETVLSVAVAVNIWFFMNKFLGSIGIPSVNRLSMVIALALYALIFSRYRPYVKVILISVYYAANILFRNINGFLTTVFSLSLSETYNIISIISFIIFLILSGHYIKHFMTKHTKSTPNQFWFVFFFAIISNETCRFVLDYLWVIFVFILLIYYLIYSLASYYYQREKLVLMQKKQDEITADVNRANEMYGEMRVLRHEFKNHILTMRSYLKMEELDKLDKYFVDYLNTDGKALSYIDCGNKVVNNILNYKQTDLTSKGIKFESRVSVPETLPYEDSDIASILVNLIDNAAEASLKTDNPSVTLKILCEKSYCFITVTNPVKNDILTDNPHLKTTKKDRSSHGIGLKVVKNIVSKYNGHINFEQIENEFVVSVMLSLKANGANGSLMV